MAMIGRGTNSSVIECSRLPQSRLRRQKRNPRTSATMNQLMDRYIEVIDVDRTTRKGYESRINIHVRPLLQTRPPCITTESTM